MPAHSDCTRSLFRKRWATAPNCPTSRTCLTSTPNMGTWSSLPKPWAMWSDCRGALLYGPENVHQVARSDESALGGPRAKVVPAQHRCHHLCKHIGRGREHCHAAVGELGRQRVIIGRVSA